jgi:hypothetical protein
VEFEDKVTHSHHSKTQYYVMLYQVLWPRSTKLHTVHQFGIINQEVCETIQSNSLESQVITKLSTPQTKDSYMKKSSHNHIKTDVCTTFAL